MIRRNFKKLDLTGQRFTRLVVVCPNFSYGSKRWECTCDCGKTVVAKPGHLLDGNVKSCGCYHLKINTIGNLIRTHGMSGTKIYKLWHGALSRCRNPRHSFYEYYGGRGIKMCKRWHTFENFYADMGFPAPGMTLERKNNNKGYSPANCIWAPRKEQAQNKRPKRLSRLNHLITYKGETKTLTQWAEVCGVDRQKIGKRIQRGWSIEKAFGKVV